MALPLKRRRQKRRAKVLPEEVRREIMAARREHGWTQAEVGRKIGVPQMHISGIETGKIVPRYDTMLELLRVLDRDLLVVPRALVPAVRALLQSGGGEEAERPLYAVESEEPEDET